MKIWVAAVAALTVMILAVVYSLLEAKHDPTTTVLLSLLLIAGMALYLLRGSLVACSKGRK